MKTKLIFSLLFICLGFSLSSALIAQDDYYEDEPVDNYDAYADETAPMPKTKEMPQQIPQIIPPEDGYNDYQEEYPEEKQVYPEGNSEYPDENYPVSEDYGNVEESY